MRCGRELGATQFQGLLAAALRAMLNLRLSTIMNGSFETLDSAKATSALGRQRQLAPGVSRRSGGTRSAVR